MVHEHQGRRQEARQWYDRAITWTDTSRSVSRDELQRFQDEAAHVLNLAKTPSTQASLSKK
jgi:hypothetical protein